MGVATQGRSTPTFPQFVPHIEQSAVQQPILDAVKFDPKKHLSHVPPEKLMTMEDLGYPNDTGVSSLAVSHPFQLFTQEAVDMMRTEIFQEDVQAKCMFSSNIAASQLRGYAKRYARFTYDAWTHSETLAIISRIASVDLIPVCDYEIGHINYSMKTEAQVKEERRHLQIEDGSIGGCQDDRDNKPIVGWHTDSYPFVCVLMMSDCRDMKGGETAIRTADGQYMKIRGPTKGCAVIMQGKYITHQAMRTMGARERITSVTSFRPKSAFLRDDTELGTVRPVSDLNELYYDFAEYRLEIMEARIRREREQIAARRSAGTKFDTATHKSFLRTAITFVEQTNGELVEEDKVEKGFIEEMGLADAELESDLAKSTQTE